jgi:hypothetical protein
MEVEARVLYAESSPSLFAWATEELGYSEGEAQRRIDAARMLRDFPVLEPKIASGRLNLTHLSRARSFIRNERKAGRPPVNALELLSELEGKSARETEACLLAKSPSAKKPREGVRRISATDVLMSFVADEKLQAGLERLREVWSHKWPEPKLSELIGALVEDVLEREDPVKKAERAAARKTAARAGEPATAGAGGASSASGPPTEVIETGEVQYCFNVNADPELPPRPAARRAIPAHVRHAVWRRDHGQCTHVNSAGERCRSRFRVEPDHLIPHALGGPETVENLFLKCRVHNTLAAHRAFGREHMERVMAKARASRRSG